MRFDIALIPSLLLASAVVARHNYRNAHRQTRSSNGVGNSTHGITEVANTDWGGIVLKGNNFDNVTGTLVVPSASMTANSSVPWTTNSSVSFAVGIDGVKCENATFQTGVRLDIGPNGEVAYTVWYTSSDAVFDYEAVCAKEGDVLVLSIWMTSNTTAIILANNLSNGQAQFKSVSSLTPLCREEVEWVAEVTKFDSQRAPLANFSMTPWLNVQAADKFGYVDLSAEAQYYFVGSDEKPQTFSRIDSGASAIFIDYI